jgi:NADH/NAD ratio-sensing transcriptional regulator Rex
MNKKYLDEHEKDLYDFALKKWGTDLQVDMLIQEMSELTHALLKLRQKKFNNKNKHETFKEYIDNIEQEIADVQIMLNQIKLLFNKENIDEWKFKKLERLLFMQLEYLGRDKSENDENMVSGC